MAQTLLASLKFRKRYAKIISQNSQDHILDCGDNVRLKASVTRHEKNRGLFVFLHGWEGSQDSTYVLSCARFVYGQGYSVFRLNFRDHGDTHHLNEGLFHSVLFDEVNNGVRQAVNFSNGAPIYLVGFSLGGNFALRVARSLNTQPFSELRHIFAISPVIDPVNSAPKVDESRLVRRYFHRKWTRSLRKKQQAFPDLYDFEALLKQKSVLDLTANFLSAYSEFESPHEYFSAYRINKDDLSAVKTPVSMIMSKDDPVIEAADIMKLEISSCVSRIMLKYGGHNGFFQSLTGPTWYDDYISEILRSEK